MGHCGLLVCLKEWYKCSNLVTQSFSDHSNPVNYMICGEKGVEFPLKTKLFLLRSISFILGSGLWSLSLPKLKTLPSRFYLNPYPIVSISQADPSVSIVPAVALPSCGNFFAPEKLLQQLMATTCSSPMKFSSGTTFTRLFSTGSTAVSFLNPWSRDKLYLFTG